MKGRAGTGGLSLEGYGRGYHIWPLYKVIERMSSLRELRALGEALKPNAHELAERLLRIAADSERDEGDPVLIPPGLLSEAVLLLLALAGPRRGRPPKLSTSQVLQRLAEGQSKRGAALAVARATGEPFETVRRRQGLRAKKSGKPEKKRGA